jgi:FlaA1/EpsC-like NDP-sugar epimerase
MEIRLKILPRWIVFLLDIVIICLCLLFTMALKLNLEANLDFIHLRTGFRAMILIVLTVNIALFYTFKSYAGIVRYTTMEDISRLVMVNALAAIIYLAVNAFLLPSEKYFSFAVVSINFFVTTFIIVSYRLGVKYTFTVYKSMRIKERIVKKNAAVYGTNADSLHIKNMLNSMPSAEVEVVAFMDDNLRTTGKLLEGLPIFNSQDGNLQKLKNEGVELILLPGSQISNEILNRLVEYASAYGIKLQQVPAMNDWLNGRLDTQQLRDINIEDLLEREVIKIHNEAIYSELKGKKILVTGAAGSIGSELVRQLTQYRPSLIIMCDQAETPMHEMTLEMNEKYKHITTKSYIGDICDRNRMEHLFEVYAPQFVFHAAAYKHVPLMEDNPSIAVINNVLGTKILAELAVANLVEKFVMVSTDKAVNPTNIMGASKRIAEIFTQSFFKSLTKNTDDLGNKHITKFVTTRFGNVLGSNGSVLPRFKAQLAMGGPITVTHPDITRYFMTIPEACLLVIEAGVMGQGGEIFVFDMGKPVKIADLAKKLISLSGKKPDVDIKIVFTGLRPGEKLYEELLNDAENFKPTYHDKIMIADVRQYDFSIVEKKIEKLISSARQHYTLETVSLMKDLVPEFVSNNVNYAAAVTSDKK